MTNYKINKNKAPLSAEQVLKHKDFNQVMQNYKELHNYKKATNPLYKNKKFLGFMILLVTMIVVIVLVEREEPEPKKQAKQVMPVIKETPKVAADSVAPAAAKSVKVTEAAPAARGKVVKKPAATIKKQTVVQQHEDTVSARPVEEFTNTPAGTKQEGANVEIKNGKDLIYQKDKQQLMNELMRRHNQKEVNEDQN